jgi:hypothetical protein
VGLALLAGLLIAAAACGDEGAPQSRPAGAVATPATARSTLSAHTPSPSAVGGEPSATLAAATFTSAGTVPPPTVVTATPTEPVATPTATVFVPATLGFGYDMDVGGNSATALDNIDRCISVSAEGEDEFQVDVFIDKLTQDSIAGFQYFIGFPENVVKIVEQDHLMLLTEEPGSDIADLSDPVPASSSPHLAAVADFGAAEYAPPYSQGVLGRYKFKVLPAAPAGSYALTLTTVVAARAVSPNPDYPDYPLAGEIPIAVIWDGDFEPQYGVIAVDVSCGTVAARAN